MDESKHAEEREIATDLVARIANGDRHAEADLVKRYSRGLLFLLRRKTRNPDLAKDLLQETWAIALTSIRDRQKPDDAARLAGYLCGIARNLASGERRRAERQKTTTDSEAIDLARDASASPYTGLSRAETCRYVQSMLSELTRSRDREILNRFYVREEDKDQICRDLSLDSAHFNRVLFRARQRLKDAILRDETRNRLKVVG